MMESATVPRPESLRAGAPVDHQSVYLWHWPVRAMHWIAAVCVLTLVVTGLYIGKPYFFTSGQPADHFMMGRFRFLHFAAAGVLVATAILRFYWLFMGNRYERWRALFPVSKADWVNMWRLLRRYLFVKVHEVPHYLGHNPLQQLFYTSVYAMALFQVVSGFYLYGLYDTGGFFFTAFGWVGPLFGGAQVVRVFHHVVTWFWLIFLPIHVYLSVRADVLHNEARITSMISGKRFVRSDVEFIDE
jgi:Ni/Fe-hydrogenase b-type cytochrome subunit